MPILLGGRPDDELGHAITVPVAARHRAVPELGRGWGQGGCEAGGAVGTPGGGGPGGGGQGRTMTMTTAWRCPQSRGGGIGYLEGGSVDGEPPS